MTPWQYCLGRFKSKSDHAKTFHKLLFKCVVTYASYFVMHFTALNFIRYLLKYTKSKFKKKNPHREPIQNICTT